MAEPHRQGALIGVEPIGRRYYRPVWRFPPPQEQGVRMWAHGRYDLAVAKAQRTIRNRERGRG